MDKKNISISYIDDGKSFDWGKTSEDYAKYRDIYPDEFYRYILKLGLCKDGQRVLDIGTGTGVLPRNMYGYGAKWTGTDIAENQIQQAKKLAAKSDMDIDFFVCKAEDVDFPDEYLEYFNLVSQEEFRVDVLFTREAWHGRMRACRGVGASMASEELMKWDEEHWQMLMNDAPEKFNIKHYISIAELERKNSKAS